LPAVGADWSLGGLDNGNDGGVADLADPGLLVRLDEGSVDLLSHRHLPLKAVVLEDELGRVLEIPIVLEE